MSYVSRADLGGSDGQGRVVPEPEPATFHAPWEAQVHALTIAMSATGVWNIDMSRSARETLPNYASLTYYEKWFGALENLLLERGLVTRAELAEGKALAPPLRLSRMLAAADVRAVLSRGAPSERVPTAPARFRTGDRVRTRAEAVQHHTRLPSYARGKVGRVEAVRGMHVFPDTNARGLGEQPQWLYTVVLSARELWGGTAEANSEVSIDAFEPYLESAP